MSELCSTVRLWGDSAFGELMKFLCDVHIPIKLSKRLDELGHESEHVNKILNRWNSTDEEISRFADLNKLTLITKDQDFRNSFLLKRKPKRLIKVSLGNISNKELLELFEDHIHDLQKIHDENESVMVEINKENIWIITK